MSPVARRTFDAAKQRYQLAAHLLEDAAESGEVALIGEAYAAVLVANGELAAFERLLEIEELGKADTQRPEHMPPRLALVRP